MFTVAVIDNEKEIWLYDDKEHYTFKYSGTDTGTMDINVEEYDNDGNISRKVKHVNVALEKDLTYTSSDDMTSGNNTYDLEENGSGKNIKPVVDTLNKELTKYKVNIKNGYMVNSENRGYTGSYYAGEKFTIYANIPDGAVWTGWKSNISDNIFSDKSAKVTTITMPAGDRELSATYNINSASTTPDVSPSIAPTLPPENSSSTKPSGTSESNISNGGNGGFISGGGVATVYTATPIPSPSQTPVPVQTTAPVTTPTPVVTPTPTIIPTIEPEASAAPSVMPSPSASPDTETDNKTDSEKNIKKGLKFTNKKTKAVYKITSTRKNKSVQYVRSTKKNITNVTVPASVQFNGKTFKVVSIGKGAFKNNKKLKAVKISKNITSIEANAFNKCTSLIKITIPAKVKKIGKKAFYKCKNLQYILVKSELPRG